MRWGKWWVVTDSNRRHSRCKRDALPTELTTRRRAFSEAERDVQGGRMAGLIIFTGYLTSQSVIIPMPHGTTKIR